MLKFQRKIFFCVLFAAIWMQSTKAALTDKDKEEIKDLEKSLIHAKELGPKLIPRNGIQHFNAWRFWDQIPDSEKLKILANYKRLSEPDLIPVKKLKKKVKQFRLADCAYKALNRYVLDELEIIVLQVNGDRRYENIVRSVALWGHFLDLIAFCYGQSKSVYDYIATRRFVIPPE